ncbi:outer membrane lipoprotein chaperone LolA, partial [Pseudomonas syringae]
MRLFRMLLATALTFSAISAHADSKDVARLTQLLEKSQTLTARFSQLTLDGGGTQLQETAGEMALQRAGLFNWHTDAPQEQLMVSDGKKVSLWDPDLEQVTIK